MLNGVRRLIDDEGSVNYAAVQRLASDFERHATAYDGSYADRLSEALRLQANEVAVA